MNLRQAEARVIELTGDVRAVEATTTKQGQNIIADALTAADSLKLVKRTAELLTGRVTDAIKVGREIPKLGSDQVVARWDELTGPALLIRAQMRRGGEQFKHGAKKTDLIAFLTNDEPVKAEADDQIAADAGESAGDVDGELSGAALDKMMGPEAEGSDAEAA